MKDLLHKLISIIRNRIAPSSMRCYLKHTTRGNNIFEGYNAVDRSTKLNESYLGLGSYISFDCNIKRAKIGKFCSIGPRVYIGYSSHPTSNWVTTHPAFYLNLEKVLNYSFHKGTDPLYNAWKEATPGYLVTIGSDVWIGGDVKIMDGIRIGNGAIIAAGAVVTKDVPPYSIVGGIPAKVIKYRFDSDDISFLENFQWWNKSKEWIEANYQQFNDVKSFKKLYGSIHNN